eukprot:XP_006378336.2 myb-related protein 305 [Populus trichocarpa]
MGLTKRQWTLEEDQILISYIQNYGTARLIHFYSSNCIKITGGGQTMRSRMYGTLDHLKKRLVQNGESKPQQYIRIPNSHANDTKLSESANSTIPSLSGSESIGYAQMSPQPSSIDHSSVMRNTSITTAETNSTSTSMIKVENMDSSEIYPVIDENSWSEPQVFENSSMPSNFLDDLQFPFPSADTMEPAGCYGYVPDIDDDMKFWHHLFAKSQGIK